MSETEKDEYSETEIVLIDRVADVLVAERDKYPRSPDDIDSVTLAEVLMPLFAEVRAAQREADAKIAETYNKGYAQHPDDAVVNRTKQRIAGNIRGASDD